jgi:hypothetical protein
MVRKTLSRYLINLMEEVSMYNSIFLNRVKPPVEEVWLSAFEK